MEIRYSPRRWTQLLPAEVVDRGELLSRIAGRELADRQRADFHQLIVCTAGTGTHHVDFEPISLSAGTVLRIHPGQVQRFVPDNDLEALMILWPRESHHADPDGVEWYPGSNEATHWHLDDDLFKRLLVWVEEIQQEQERFNGSNRHISLMKALLCSLLLRLAAELPNSAPSVPHLPAPYLDFRRLIEERLYERPGITDLAHDLGYSSRTLDRACQLVTGQTAKQVLDERIALEIHRLLTHSDRSVAQVANEFGFGDPSNFSKFVKRHLGQLPRQIRQAAS